MTTRSTLLPSLAVAGSGLIWGIWWVPLRNLEAGLTPIAGRDHIAVLGWTTRTAQVVQELVMSDDRVGLFFGRKHRRALQVVLSPGGDVAEDQLLGHAAPEQDVETVEQLGARHEIAVLGRALLRVAESRHAAGDDRDLRGIEAVPGVGPSCEDRGLRGACVVEQEPPPLTSEVVRHVDADVADPDHVRADRR